MNSEQALLMVMNAYHHILWSGMQDWDNYVHLHTLNTLLHCRQEIIAEQIPLRLRSFRPTVTELYSK
jgi:hypothetical protein